MSCVSKKGKDTGKVTHKATGDPHGLTRSLWRNWRNWRKWRNWENCYSPPGWDASPLQGYPQQYVLGTHLYTWVERDNVGQSFLSKETTRWQETGFEPPTFRCEACCPPTKWKNSSKNEIRNNIWYSFLMLFHCWIDCLLPSFLYHTHPRLLHMKWQDLNYFFSVLRHLGLFMGAKG